MQLLASFHVMFHRGHRLVAIAFAAVAISLPCGLADADAKRRGKPVDTTITSGPAAGSVISSATPTFSFTANIAESSFECKLDADAFANCTSPVTAPALPDGAHTFSVRATDPSGKVDASPASRSFTVSTATSPPPSPPSSGAAPTSWTRFASFESDLNSGTDHGWRIDSPFSVSRTAEVGASDGASAAKIVTNGGNSSCSCPRMTFDGFSYDAGREFWIGGSWRVPEPGKLTWSRLMNIGHFESSDDPDNWYVGLVVRSWGMQVVARRYHTEAGASVLMPPRAIPQNRWFDVDLHLKLSPTDGQALTEVYLDGTLIATSTARNMLSGGPLHFFNAGLPHFWDGNGDARVFFDAPRLQD